MSHVPKLTRGAIKGVLEKPVRPVFQVLDIGKMYGEGGRWRYRLSLTDGEEVNKFTLLSTQLNQVNHENELPIFSIIRADQYTATVMEGKGTVIIISQLTVLVNGKEFGKVVDNQFDDSDGESNLNSTEDSNPGPHYENVVSMFDQIKIE